MTIYLDIIFLLNLFFDFLILLTVNVILKRNIKLKKILFGSLFGSISIFILFFNLPSILMILFKIILCILISLITFGYKDIKYLSNNIFYFFTTSIILGGFLYYLNLKINFKNIGLSYFSNGMSLNFYFLVIFSPIILYIYMKQIKKLKVFYSLKYEVDVYLNNNKIVPLNGYLDTGNTLKDPYKNRMVVVAQSSYFKKELTNEKIFFIPYSTISSLGVMKCFKPKNVYIKGIGLKNNILIGLVDKKLKTEGINCILNKNILEER